MFHHFESLLSLWMPNLRSRRRLILEVTVLSTYVPYTVGIKPHNILTTHPLVIVLCEEKFGANKQRSLIRAIFKTQN